MNPKQSWNIRWAARLLLACGGLTLTIPGYAQSQGGTPQTEMRESMITASGTVIGSDGEPVIGASVLAKGKSIGASTDLDGKFSLKVPAGTTLVISYVGCVTQEVKATSTPMEIHLKDDALNLDEVVVVGFGTQKKVNLTGSVSVADQKALKERPQISHVRQRNKLINDANHLIATKAHGESLYVYNRLGNESVSDEPGLNGITYTSLSPCSQAMAIQNSDNEIILQSTGNGSFNLPDDMRIKNISSGRFDDSERWISAKAINLNGNKIEIEEASIIKI